jgi:hypothetical protein
MPGVARGLEPVHAVILQCYLGPVQMGRSADNERLIAVIAAGPASRYLFVHTAELGSTHVLQQHTVSCWHHNCMGAVSCICHTENTHNMVFAVLPGRG